MNFDYFTPFSVRVTGFKYFQKGRYYYRAVLQDGQECLLTYKGPFKGKRHIYDHFLTIHCLCDCIVWSMQERDCMGNESEIHVQRNHIHHVESCPKLNKQLLVLGNPFTDRALYMLQECADKTQREPTKICFGNGYLLDFHPSTPAQSGE